MGPRSEDGHVGGPGGVSAVGRPAPGTAQGGELAPRGGRARGRGPRGRTEPEGRSGRRGPRAPARPEAGLRGGAEVAGGCGRTFSEARGAAPR